MLSIQYLYNQNFCIHNKLDIEQNLHSDTYIHAHLEVSFVFSNNKYLLKAKAQVCRISKLHNLRLKFLKQLLK